MGLVILSYNTFENAFITKVSIILENNKSTTNKANSYNITGFDYSSFYNYIKG